MQIADFNHQDFAQGAQSKLDDQLLVKFFTKQRPDNAATKEKGRPIFKDIEYIDIKVPGHRGSGACRAATFVDKQRFPRHYEAYKQRKEMPLDGTPLSEWPVIARTQVEELSFHNVKTVEQLVSMNDSLASQFMGMNALKTKAKMWLEGAEETARINEIQDLKAAGTEKDERIAKLEEQMLGLMNKFDDLTTKQASKKTKV